ncbi:MAG: TauD/TfdA family dioxygenase [Alphaproteobacteria bacterium]|nr:TauD/TfdA family dioxygenase [Alphaproteobacteria bacterium]
MNSIRALDTEEVADPSPAPLSLTALSSTGAAEIPGLNLSRSLPSATIAAIRRALCDSPVLVFRDQSLSKSQQAAFSAQFGELEGHIGKLSDGSTFPLVHTLTNLDAERNVVNMDVAKLNWFWHTDKSYHAVPSFVTILHALEVTPEGGETQFSNAHLAWAALPPATQARLDGLQAVHDWVASRINSGTSPATAAQRRERPPVTHPLVRTHPETGRKSLYIGVHVSHVAGLPESESKALIAELTRHIGKPEFLYTHRWEKGDVVMWDNRALHHRALANYEIAAHPRVLNRTVVVGTRPV